MGNLVSFKKRRFHPRKIRSGYQLPWFWLLLILIALILWVSFSNTSQYSDVSPQKPGKSVHFSKCGWGVRYNCVVDGDTFYLDGQKIRVADIDTPETRGARCRYEARLGARAENRFRQLLNEGPISLKAISGRDKDRYGRKLRIVYLNGRSIGDILVEEGLARKWRGRRLPWCK